MAQTTYPQPQQQSAPQKTDDTMMSAKSFAKLDVNADGKISEQEQPPIHRNKKFADHDAIRDGSLSEAEYNAAHMKETGTRY